MKTASQPTRNWGKYYYLGSNHSDMVPLTGRERPAAAALLLVAALMHEIAAFDPHHLEEQLFVTFFWAVVFAQAITGFALFLRLRWAAQGAILLNVLLVLTFVVTRFVPVPGENQAEPVEAIGLLTKAVEIAALPLLARIARAPLRVGRTAQKPTDAS